MRKPFAENWAYAYFLVSAALLLVWMILYAVRADLRSKVVWVSLGTMVMGLTEPLFVPEYWDPPTLWNLARRTGFDIESLIFSFAVGGIVFALYHVIFGAAPDQSIAHERHQSRHRYHLLAVVSGPGLFSVLLFLTNLNPIYSASIGMLGGFVAALYCRPDLWLKMVSSGFLFFGVYFAVFSLFNLGFPGYVLAVWNLTAVSGVLIWGVPAEELMFAFAFGLYWSSVYEHLTWRSANKRVRVLRKNFADGPA